MLFKLILINKMVIGGHTINSLIFCIQSHSFVFVSGGGVGVALGALVPRLI